MERDGHKCGYCGSPFPLVIDHIWPVHKGGDNHDSNLITACRSCNASKRAFTLPQWRYRAPAGVRLDYAFAIFHGEAI